MFPYGYLDSSILFFFFFLNLAGSSLLLHRLSPSCSGWGLLFFALRGFIIGRLLLLRVQSSRHGPPVAAALRLRSTGSAVVIHRLSWPTSSM